MPGRQSNLLWLLAIGMHSVTSAALCLSSAVVASIPIIDAVPACAVFERACLVNGPDIARPVGASSARWGWRREGKETATNTAGMVGAITAAIASGVRDRVPSGQ
jgi:hypothetical protein